jgi:hypothetical protein
VDGSGESPTYDFLTFGVYDEDDNSETNATNDSNKNEANDTGHVAVDAGYS